jgi:hypothetical protein
MRGLLLDFARRCPRMRNVEIRHVFGSLSFEEAAGTMNLSKITIVREWNKAKVWLLRELGLKAGDER